MFVDASVLAGILLGEDDADALSNRLAAARRRITAPIAIYETVMALMRANRMPHQRAQEIVEDLLSKAGIEVVPITEEMGREALMAFERYGKGRAIRPSSIWATALPMPVPGCWASACSTRATISASLISAEAQPNSRRITTRAGDGCATSVNPAAVKIDATPTCWSALTRLPPVSGKPSIAVAPAPCASSTATSRRSREMPLPRWSRWMKKHGTNHTASSSLRWVDFSVGVLTARA